MNPTEEINRWINQYGNEREALYVALAKLQVAYTWILADERCPNCYGHVNTNDKTATRKTEGGVEFVVHSYNLVCCECGAVWSSGGVELETFGA